MTIYHWTPGEKHTQTSTQPDTDSHIYFNFQLNRKSLKKGRFIQKYLDEGLVQCLIYSVVQQTDR